MATRADNQAVAFSEKAFQRLLGAYPKAHREEYGAAMAQLFRDQCRDAWNESRGWGLARLWLRVLPDVIGTSLMEHLEAIKERKFMLNRISTLFRSAQTYKFFTVLAAVFLLVVISVTLITFLLPEEYVGTARILVRKFEDPSNTNTKNTQTTMGDYDPYFIQTEFELMRSQVVLSKVVEKLNLNQKWGTKFHGSKQLTASEAIDLLTRSIDLRPIRNTALIEIRAYSDKPEEATELANATAEAYRNYKVEQRRLVESGEPAKTSHAAIVEIVDKATLQLKSARPNVPANIVVGIFLGTLLGLIAGAGVAGISFLSRRNSPPKIAS